MDGFAEGPLEQEGCGDFGPLPALAEDEENVSLADVLSLQDSCLTEHDIWAICLECSQSLKSIAHSAIFYTLCITPDTLAFNTNGNVCFMEQISDDPECAFVPPEIDVTGNTFAVHIFSLGATLKAAAEYMMKPEIDSKFSQDLHALLEQMQVENPKERPDLENVISICKEKLKFSSSTDICQCLYSIGRRVLSIEPCDNFQDSCDNMWEEKACEGISPYDHCTEDNVRENSSLEEDKMKAAGGRNASGLHAMNYNNRDRKEIKNGTLCGQNISTWVTKCKEDNSNIKYKNTSEIGSEVFEETCLRKVKTLPMLPFVSETDARTSCLFTRHNGPLTKKRPRLQHKPLAVIHNNEHIVLGGKLRQSERSNEIGSKASYFQVTNNNLEDFCLDRERTCVSKHHMTIQDDKKAHFLPYNLVVSETSDSSDAPKGPHESRSGHKILENYDTWEHCGETSSRSNENGLLHINRKPGVVTALNEHGCSSILLSSTEHIHSERKGYYIEDIPNGDRESEMKDKEQSPGTFRMTEFEACKWCAIFQVSLRKGFRSTSECAFLKHLLIQYGKPLKDYELWALCHECLLTLETYADYPAYLCLDSVVINCDGSVLFVSPKSEGSYDMLYLAPEMADEGFVTEKVCIYCIAAILWRAAKCNFPPDHKLVLPRKLKNFLLDMARRKSEDRPSLAEAIKICDSYLLEQSINSKRTLAFLIKSTFQAFREMDPLNDSFPFDFQSERNTVNENIGFLPMNNENKLIAVKGPVPCQPSLSRGSTMLPHAFTSSATHFKPIILQQNTDIQKDTVASTEVHCGTTVEKVDSKNSVHLNIDAKNQIDENPDLPAAYMMSGILEHGKQKLETLLQNDPEEQSPSHTSSSQDKLPLYSESSFVSQEKYISQAPSSSHSNCTMSSSMAFINNFLLKQDPETRVLTLVPVQIAISEQIPNKPLHSIAYSCCPSLHVLLTDSVLGYDANKNLQNNSPANNLRNSSSVQNECWDMKIKSNSLPPPMMNKETQTKCSEKNTFHTFCKESNKDAKSRVPLPEHKLHASTDQNPACSLALENSHQDSRVNEVFLKNVVHLIQEEFAFNDYLDDTAEALTIGKYISSLKDLKYNTFCNAISEKFCDLYWEEKLLGKLYAAANGRTSLSGRENETKNIGRSFQSQNESNYFPNASEETNVSIAEVMADDLPQDNTANEVMSQEVIIGATVDEECLQMNTYSSLPVENPKKEEGPVKMEENISARSPSIFELYGLCPGWISAFYGPDCFNMEVLNYVRKLGKKKTNGTQNIDAKKVELEQLIMIETKNYRKSVKFYQRLLHKERRSKGGEVKAMLPRLKGQLEEMKSKVQFLELVKKYLQIMFIEKWGVETCNLITVANLARSKIPPISSLDCMLLFYNINKTQCKDNQKPSRNLQAGTPVGLMAYLYSRNAFLEGYVHQFLFIFRYFCTQEELLQFLLDRIRITLANSSPESCSLLSKICHRSFSILQTWIEDCYTVDFTINPGFMSALKDFIVSKVVPLNGYGKWLLSLLDHITSKNGSSVLQWYRMEEWEEEKEINETPSLNPSYKRISKEILQKNFNWKLSKGSEVSAPSGRDGQYSIASVLSKPGYTNVKEESSIFCAKLDEGPYFLTEYTAQQLCCQLTLLEQEIFHKCHPVHFLNSRVLGVKDKSVPLQRSSSSELLPTQVYNLFVKNCVQDDYLLKLLKYADNVSTWVAAEIVTSYSSKVQVNLLSKFLSIAKCCYEQRNFATAMQILRGLENLIVRQLPAWKCLPSKVSDIMEELKAVEVFLKSDSLCLMEGEKFKTSPTIPSAHVLAMHVQQLETGGFTMRNGTYKWTKLRNIAKVVSQIHAFQENPYDFLPDHQLQSFLRQRIDSLNNADISSLAADNCTNFYRIQAEKQSQKIQDTLHRMKAMFQ